MDMSKEYSSKGFFGGYSDTGAGESGPPLDDLAGKFDCYGRSEVAKLEERRQAKFWADATKADVNARIERAKIDNRIPQMAIHIASVNTWLELGTCEVLIVHVTCL